jgi:hypothetical protein
MAAVFALILIPVIASVGGLLHANLGGSLAAKLAMLMFAALAFGVFGSVLKMAARWENEQL